jgi:hypothetical protein
MERRAAHEAALSIPAIGPDHRANHPTEIGTCNEHDPVVAESADSYGLVISPD